MGYPSVQGRLHTRYAPVRRSPPSEDVLPLDLHVLGLPLAFILSQDQTLRCKYKKFNIFRSRFTCLSEINKVVLNNLAFLCFKILKNLRKKTSTFVLPLNAGHLLFYYFSSGFPSLKISRLSQNSFPF